MSLFLVALGIGVGVSITSSETTVERGIITTKFIRPVMMGYSTGWVYNRADDGSFYEFRMKLFKSGTGEEPVRGWLQSYLG